MATILAIQNGFHVVKMYCHKSPDLLMADAEVGPSVGVVLGEVVAIGIGAEPHVMRQVG